MKVLFIQGGGQSGYEEDMKLVASLQTALGTAYKVYYPPMQVDESAPDFGWLRQIDKYIDDNNDNVILVAHSLGASLVLKYLSEYKMKKKIAGVFLIATPFWRGKGNWVKGLKLRTDFADKLPKDIPTFFYHCKDDKEVPFDDLLIYKQKIPFANFREITKGGHQLGNDLTPVAKDIKRILHQKA